MRRWEGRPLHAVAASALSGAGYVSKLAHLQLAQQSKQRRVMATTQRTGVRPSSGAAKLKGRTVMAYSEGTESTELAAPEDGRTPLSAGKASRSYGSRNRALLHGHSFGASTSFAFTGFFSMYRRARDSCS